MARLFNNVRDTFRTVTSGETAKPAPEPEPEAQPAFTLPTSFVSAPLPEVGGSAKRAQPGRPAGEKTTATNGHRKTSTGYVRAGGKEMVRLTLHMTTAQKRTLKARALEAGYESPSAFILQQLGLTDR